MVTIVIPLYNKEETIERALESIRGQREGEYEVVVVDDGSTDGGIERVRAWKRRNEEERLRIVEQRHRGVSAARNRGIAEGRYEWVTFLDADDEWKPQFLEECRRLKERYGEATVLATAYERQDRRGKRRAIRLRGIAEESEGYMDNYFEVASQSDPPFCSISVMIEKSRIEGIGGFPEGVGQGEDLLTWAKLAVGERIAYTAKSLAIFHVEEMHRMERPRREPTGEDRVGEELERLYERHKDVEGLRGYLSHWHKMRASMYLRIPGGEKNCKEEIERAQRWKKNKKLTMYRLLLLLPYPIRMRIMEKI